MTEVEPRTTIVLVPPTVQRVPGGTADPPNITWSGSLLTDDIITWGHASANKDAGVTRTDFDSYLFRDPGRILTKAVAVLWTATDVLTSFTINISGQYHLELLGGGQPVDTSHGYVNGYHAELERKVVNYCEYGTELSDAGNAVVYLTTELLQAWFGRYGLNWLEQIMAGFLFTTIDANALCSLPPPPMPHIDLSTFDASAQTLTQILYAVAWANLCRCKAGATTPTPYPPPTATQPPNWPVAPTFGCDNVDPCAALIRIQQQLAALGQTLNSNWELTTLIQRYRTPFAFIHGATHSGLTGSGAFAVPHIAAIKIVVTQFPPENTVFTGVPLYVSDLGWISVLTDDGMIDEIRLTRTVQTWSSPIISAATQLGYGLREGVVADIQELYAEP